MPGCDTGVDCRGRCADAAKPRARCNRAPMTERCLKPPWTVAETPATYRIEDATGFALLYVYYEEEPGRRSAARLLTTDEARRIAVKAAILPEMLKAPGNAASLRTAIEALEAAADTQGLEQAAHLLAMAKLAIEAD